MWNLQTLRLYLTYLRKEYYDIEQLEKSPTHGNTGALRTIKTIHDRRKEINVSQETPSIIK